MYVRLEVIPMLNLRAGRYPGRRLEVIPKFSPEQGDTRLCLELLRKLNYMGVVCKRILGETK